MKKIILLLCVCMSFFLGAQDDPVFEWAARQGGVLGDRGHSIATDTFGNVYTTGSFSSTQSDTADFDPGPSFYGLVSNGGADIFISKLSPEGDLIWAVSFGSSDYDAGYGITTDVSGNVYVTGLFHGWIDFDPGPEVHSLFAPFSYSSAFVLKLDSNGSFAWAKELGDGSDFTIGVSWGNAITLDTLGNVYTTGQAKDGSDFDPGPDEYILTTNTNSSNIFISKLDNDGNFVWAKAIGGEGIENSNSIAIDQFNNIHITGNFQGMIDFDPNSGTHTLSAINGDLYILKLNSFGGFIWAKNMGGPLGGAIGKDITTDNTGNVYTTGFFIETIDFNPGILSFELSANEADMFILKLNIDGDFIWVKSIGGNGYSDFGNAVTVDKFNNVYITGVFQDTVDFDPDLETYNLFSEEGGVFVLKLDTDGSFIWAVSFPAEEGYSGEYNEGAGIVLDQWFNIYTTGTFWRTTDFNPTDTAVYYLIADDVTDIFIQKMNQPCPASLRIEYSNNNAIICSEESITLNAVLPPNIEGVTIDWSTGDTSDFIIVTPDSDAIYSLSVNYTVNNIECFLSDSVETIVLQTPETTYLEFTTCDALEAGVEELVYASQNGCDSLVIETTILTLPPESPIAPADLVIQENQPPTQLSIFEVTNATEYIWTVPDGTQILFGQGTNAIIVDWNGLNITDSVCVSSINECGISAAICITVEVDIVDAVEELRTKDYIFFPNPTDDLLTIEFESNKYYQVTLLDLFGRQARRLEATSGQSKLSTKDLPSGTYWLRIIPVTAPFEDDWHWERIEVQR